MKLLNAVGPNPRKVRMFLHEKGIELPLEEVDLFGGENRRPPYTEHNPAGQLPSLEMDDGTWLGETVAICEYLEELYPDTALVGSNARERAETRMWLRRVEFNITEFAYAGFRYAEGLELFRDRILCLPDAADGMKRKARAGMEWIDGQLAGRQFLCGDRFSLADIVLYCALDFVGSVGQPIPDALESLHQWFDRVNARPSAEASLSPSWREIGMRL
ncbi:glutathione S-transferase family protein [Algiphilus aromaticivorans]|uniref:glutathione S-transferase family protein n=1 Tax=Algiphilus aromaticivorans TaxID=382454 RepID=UPI0005C1EA3D|nr:glutathione S-transferase family protein [Algiphilus aromaticivorans]